MGARSKPRKTIMSDPVDLPEAAPKVLTPAAQRALAEAEARRRAIDEKAAAAKAEKGGRGGLDPARYGDWEIKGLTADF
jgi:hypothetical protein